MERKIRIPHRTFLCQNRSPKAAINSANSEMAGNDPHQNQNILTAKHISIVLTLYQSNALMPSN
jgi:hypothetical protein